MSAGDTVRIKSLPVIGLLIALSVVAASCGGGEEATPTLAPAATDTPTPSASVTEPAGETVTIQLTESPYGFNPADLTFEAGKAYTLSFNAPGEFHTFTIEDLDINIFINANQAVTEPITFDQAGSFELICVPHQFQGMVGTVTVL